jgi:hypothetical protein
MNVSSRRLAFAIAAALAGLGLSAGPATASHAHFIHQPAHGNHAETCRYIAAGQTEKAPDEPGGHAFHQKVHTGQPGSDDHGTDFDKQDNAGSEAYEDCVWVNTP